MSTGNDGKNNVLSKLAAGDTNSDAQALCSVVRADPDGGERSSSQDLTEEADETEVSATHIDRTTAPVLCEKSEIELQQRDSEVEAKVDNDVNEGKENVEVMHGTTQTDCIKDDKTLSAAPPPHGESTDDKLTREEVELLVESLIGDIADEIVNPCEVLKKSVSSESENSVAQSDNEHPKDTPKNLNKDNEYVLKNFKNGNREFKLLLRDKANPCSEETTNPRNVENKRNEASATAGVPICLTDEESTSPNSDDSSIVSLEPISAASSVDSAIIRFKLNDGYDSMDTVSKEQRTNQLRATAEEWFPNKKWSEPGNPVHTRPGENLESENLEALVTTVESSFGRANVHDSQESTEDAFDDEEEDSLFPVKVGKYRLY